MQTEMSVICPHWNIAVSGPHKSWFRWRTHHLRNATARISLQTKHLKPSFVNVVSGSLCALSRESSVYQLLRSKAFQSCSRRECLTKFPMLFTFTCPGNSPKRCSSVSGQCYSISDQLKLREKLDTKLLLSMLVWQRRNEENIIFRKRRKSATTWIEKQQVCRYARSCFCLYSL